MDILNKTFIDMENTLFLDEDGIDDVLLDSYNGEYTGIFEVLASKKLKRGGKLSISNHCVTPIGEVLYHVASELICYRTALMKYSLNQSNKYTNEHKLNSVCGKSAEDNRKKKTNCITRE